MDYTRTSDQFQEFVKKKPARLASRRFEMDFHSVKSLMKVHPKANAAPVRIQLKRNTAFKKQAVFRLCIVGSSDW